VRIPQFQNLGHEIMCVAYGSFKSAATNVNEVLSKTTEEPQATYFGICNPYHFVMLGASVNYTGARTTYDNYYRNPRFLKAIDEKSLEFSFLSYPLTKVLNFFDFGPILGNLFKIDRKSLTKGTAGGEQEVPPSKKGIEDMSITDRKVLLGLVKFPELPDKTLSERIKVSRQVVSKIRRKLETAGFLKTAVIPDLSRIGLGMIIFTHYTVNPKTAGKLDEKALIGAKDGQPTFFLCSGPYVFFGLSAFRNYQEFERVSERHYNAYSENKGLLRSPVVMPFSVQDLTFFRNHTYASILKNVLGL